MSTSKNVRKDMNEFWKAHSTEATLNEMMLDSNAQQLSPIDLQEVLELIPNIQDKSILELGAGIGRFTSELCKKSKQVVAVDFMENFITTNRINNKNATNLQLICADVMNLEFTESRFDIIFSNWLFMYLNDNDIKMLTSRLLKWLKPGGQFFFRESCYGQSGNIKKTANPTLYRSPLKYNDLITDVTVSTQYSSKIGFELLWSKPMETYIQYKNNRNQICWLLQVTERGGKDQTFQQFLDKTIFNENSIKFYQRVYGEDFVDCGGHVTNEKISAFLQVHRGSRVLDVGCGVGGNATYMAKQFGADVTAIDLSANLIELAREKNAMESKLHFMVADASKVDYPGDSYDVIHSCDTLFYNSDKDGMIKKFWKWLRSGGEILLIDRCCSDDVAMVTNDHNTHMITIGRYERLLKENGFTDVSCADITSELIKSLQDDLNRFNHNSPSYSNKDNVHNEILTKLQETLQKCSDGVQVWGLFFARK